MKFHDFSMKYNDFSLFLDAQTNLHEKYSCRVRSFLVLLSVALESSTEYALHRPVGCRICSDSGCGVPEFGLRGL